MIAYGGKSPIAPDAYSKKDKRKGYFNVSGVKTWLICIYVSTFALISPVGVGIGIALSETATTEAAIQNSLVTLLQGLATGTLLYVVFFEVIEKERIKGTSGLVQVHNR